MAKRGTRHDDAVAELLERARDVVALHEYWIEHGAPRRAREAFKLWSTAVIALRDAADRVDPNGG